MGPKGLKTVRRPRTKQKPNPRKAIMRHARKFKETIKSIDSKTIVKVAKSFVNSIDRMMDGMGAMV